MRTNGHHEVIARIAGQGLVLAASLAMVLSSSGAGRAQTSAASPTAPAATPAKTTPPAQVAQPAAAAAERKPRGNHEGIQVHGHWVIEVKNPDGTVTARREFENSIQPYGMVFLASVMAGNNSSGGLSVLLRSRGNKFWYRQQLFQRLPHSVGPARVRCWNQSV